MIRATCINRYKDTQGNIVGYCLQAGQVSRDFSSEELKKLIKNRKISVSNLTLTRDNKLRLKEGIERDIPEKNVGHRSFDDMGRDMMGFWTEDNSIYNESTKTGALLKVGKSYWEINYQPTGVTRIGVWVAEGWTISCHSIDKCINELKKASNMIDEYYTKGDKVPLEKELNYDIKVFCTPTLNGQVWLMGSPIWLRNYQDIDRVIEDFENSKFRVLEIRKQLGWDKKDSFFKGLFDGL